MTLNDDLISRSKTATREVAEKRKALAELFCTPGRERAAILGRPACEAAEATAAVDLFAVHPIVYAGPQRSLEER